MKFKKILSAFTSFMVCASFLTIMPHFCVTKSSAVQSDWKFDFGGSGTQSGYTGVSASDAYSASKGYGFNTPANVANVPASGSGALNDAVQFKTTEETNTFNVDLDKGLYQITIFLGNTMRTSIKAENMLQVINMTGNNAYHTFQMPVTDGQLNIMANEGKVGYPFTISALEIKKISSNPTMKPTIWICGDSTVCNYYPLDASIQGGWGQMLNKYVDTSKYEIRNMAASGQFAKGFVAAGQFTPIEYYGKPGDIYIISIGINDTNYSNENEYYQTVTDMVKRAKAKGMKVILVKQQGRSNDISRTPLLSGRWFGGTLDTIGKEQDVQVIDLFNLSQNYYLSIGQSAVTALYMDGDTLHPNRQGAIKLAELVASQIDFDNAPKAAVMDENKSFMLKNVGSGLFMDVSGGVAASGTNVQQWGANVAMRSNSWHFKSAGDGYYYIYSLLDNGKSYLLDLNGGKAVNGTNISIYSENLSTAQCFKFAQNADGSYTIFTKASDDKSTVEVKNASKENGANVQEWELNGNDCQKWNLIPAELPIEEPATTQPITASDSKNIVIYGDANNDGIVDISDIVSIRRYLTNNSKFSLSDNAKNNCDVHEKGNGLNAQDAVAIQQFVLGTINKLPIGDSPETSNILYFAKDAIIQDGITETLNSGFTKDSYVNLNNEAGSNITWTVNAPENGNYLTTFRFANGSATDRQMKIEVNNGTEFWVQPFLTTNAWNQWAERGIVLPLKAGLNNIKLTSRTESGGPNFDYLKIEKTDEPIAETYIEPTTEITVKEDTTVYIAGDSTVQSYRASYAPQQGWGYYLQNYFTTGVAVSNQAIAGRSSKSFYDNGRLDAILSTIKKGDFLMVQFAINDSSANNAERYAPVCGKVQNPTEGSYEFYIEKYVEGAIKKGATPILVTTVIGMKAYSNGKFVNSYTNYCQAMKNIADYYKIPCIDLNSLMVSHYNSIGYDAAYKYHLCGAVSGSTDMTHFTETGANAVAGLVANAVKGLNVSISSKVK